MIQLLAIFRQRDLRARFTMYASAQPRREIRRKFLLISARGACGKCAAADCSTRHFTGRADSFVGTPDRSTMNITLSIGPVVSLIAGILILVVPRLLNYIVAVYLIIIGLLGLFGAGTFHLK